MSHHAAVTGAALGGVALAALLALLTLPACNECDSSLDPVKCTDLCTQDPPHVDCAQCTGSVKAANCPNCEGDLKAPGCVNGGDGGAGATSGSGGMTGGSSGGGSGGSGGTAGVVSGNGGVTGGIGGAGVGGEDAGPLPVDCMTNANCDYRVPLCNSEGECAPCEDDAVCIETQAELVVCDTASGSCVECGSDADCNPESATPHCVDNECVECDTHADCSGDLDKPECNADRVCAACTSATACSTRVDDREICDMRAPEMTLTEGQCVECLTHEDCPNDRPQCGTDGMCGACDEATGALACSDRMDGDIAIPFCNLRPGRETTGQCVQCVSDDATVPASTVCDDGSTHYSCNLGLGRCTTTEVGQQQPCQECVADSECSAYHKCVPYAIEDVSPTKSYCFLDRTLPPTLSACDSTRKPFINQQNVASIDGRESQYCLLDHSSCEAYRDALTTKNCMGMNANCGLGNIELDGAACADSGISTRCTYSCMSSDQCPASQPTCSIGGYCRP